MPNVFPTNVTMPEAITALGRHVPFALLHWCVNDLMEFQWLTPVEHDNWIYALRGYEFHNVMPGTLRFRSPLSGEAVYFTELMDDLYDMWIVAADEARMQGGPEYVFDNEDQDAVAAEILMALDNIPINIGRFNTIVGNIPRPYFIYDLTDEEEKE